MSFCYDNIPINLFFDEHTLLYCLTLFTFAIIWLFICVRNKYTFFEQKRIPRGPLPQLPFGNISDVIFKRTTLFYHLWKYYNRFKRKGYKYAGLYLFFKPSVIIVDPNLIECVLKEENKIENVTKIKITQKIREIFDVRIFDTFLGSDYNKIEEKYVDKFETGENIVNEKLYQFFMEIVVKISGLKHENETEKALEKLANHKNSSGFKKMLEICHPFFSCKSSGTPLENLLEKCMETRKKNDIRQTDLIQLLMDTLNTENELSVQDGTRGFLHLLTNIFTNSYSTTIFCLYELCCNLDIQDELIGEIRRFKKDNKLINLNNLLKMGYLDTIVKETFRKHPPCSIIPKVCLEDYKNTQPLLEVPKGCFIFVLVYGIHHDSNNYTNPEKFDPDRFSEENKNYVKPESFMPFGYCSSTKDNEMEFTSVLVKLAVIGILSKFKITFSERSNKLLEYSSKHLAPQLKDQLILNFVPLTEGTFE